MSSLLSTSRSLVRWLAVWLILTITHAVLYAAGWLAARLFAGASWNGGNFGPPGEALAHLAAIPLVQTVALAVVAAVRRQGRREGGHPRG